LECYVSKQRRYALLSVSEEPGRTFAAGIRGKVRVSTRRWNRCRSFHSTGHLLERRLQELPETELRPTGSETCW